MTNDAAERLLCTYRGCGKPESDSIHPRPDERMGSGRHVFRATHEVGGKRAEAMDAHRIRTAADELRATLAEDGWQPGSLAMNQLDRALAEADRSLLLDAAERCALCDQHPVGVIAIPVCYGHSHSVTDRTALAAERRPYIEALIWMSGSDDFAPGGKARDGFEKIVKPLLDAEADR